MAVDHLLELDFSTFAQLGNGMLEKQVQKLLKNAVQDMDNRPGEKRARKVQIVLSLTPKTHLEENPATGREEVVLDGAGLKVACSLKVPTRESMEFDVGFGMDQQILFNPASPHDHRQRMLPTMDVVDEPNTLSMRQVEVRPIDGRTAAAGG